MKLVNYFRVSTKRQGQSGLGLEGQVAAVEAYAQQYRATVIGEYTEIESGKRADRPELMKALAHAKRARATLVVAKLDRLARNVAFTSALMESGIEFIAVDNPHANRLTLHILSAVAEDEAIRISDRTTAALAAAKRRGVKLGASRPECRNLTASARLRGSHAAGAAATLSADAAYTDLHPMLAKARGQGASFRAIAAMLNKSGHTTRRGKAWGGAAVYRACRRLGIE